MLCDTRKKKFFHESADDSGETPDCFIACDAVEQDEEEELLRKAMSLSLEDCTEDTDEEEVLMQAIALSLAD